MRNKEMKGPPSRNPKRLSAVEDQDEYSNEHGNEGTPRIGREAPVVQVRIRGES